MKLFGIGSEVVTEAWTSTVNFIVNRKGKYAVVLANGLEWSLQDVENYLKSKP